MAIKIPSKNIYNLQNQKIKKNKIGKIEVDAENVELSKDFDAVVYSSNTIATDAFDGISVKEGQNILPLFNSEKAGVSFKSFSYYTIYYYVNAVSCASRAFYKTIDFSIPKIEANKYIQEIFSGIDKKNENNIKTSVTYNFTEYFARTSAKIKSGYSTTDKTASNDRYEISSIIPYIASIETERRTSSLPTASVSITYKWADAEDGSLTASVELEDEQNAAYAKISYDENSETYNCSIKVLCGLIKHSHILGVFSQSGSFPQTITQADTPSDTNGNPTGFVEVYEPLTIQVSFYGNILSLDVKDGKITIGSSDGTPFSVRRNELLQSSNYGRTIEETFEETLNSYKEGKENATVLCSISNYYDESGEIAVSDNGQKMCFEIGDTVIPMVYGSDGKDSAMSRYRDGSEKVFVVVGTKFIYDGAVWQELTLQEKTQGA